MTRLTLLAAQRILANNLFIEAQPITDKENIQDYKGRAHCKLRTNELPAGKSLITQDNITVVYYKQDFLAISSNAIVGYLTIDFYGTAPNVDDSIIASYIIPEFRNKGIGKLLYSEAIKKCKHLQSDDSIGIMAVRVWKSLSKNHNVKLWSNTLEEPRNFTWGLNSIPIVDNESINDSDEEFVFYL